MLPRPFSRGLTSQLQPWVLVVGNEGSYPGGYPGVLDFLYLLSEFTPLNWILRPGPEEKGLVTQGVTESRTLVLSSTGVPSLCPREGGTGRLASKDN